MTNATVIVYAEGVYQPRVSGIGRGGWSAVLQLRDGSDRHAMGGTKKQTDRVEIELTAVVEALQYIKSPTGVIVRTSSLNVRRGVIMWIDIWSKRGWKYHNGQPVDHANLWRALRDQIKRHDITFEWADRQMAQETLTGEVIAAARLNLTTEQTLGATIEQA